MSNNRKKITTTINEELLKKIKILAIEQEKTVNLLFDEGIELVLEKYKKSPK